MFIRKKKNKSGIVSIQIIDKSSGFYKVYQTIRSSSDPTEIENLYNNAKQELLSISEQSSLPFESNDELEYVHTFINSIDTLSLIGPELLLGKLFNEIGFNQIKDVLFKYLVITRLVYPVSNTKVKLYLVQFC
jgi:hypothetical protein